MPRRARASICLIARADLAQAIDALKEAEVWIVGLDQAAAELEPGSRHLKGALGLVVGSEGEGTPSVGPFQVRHRFEASHARRDRVAQCRGGGFGGVIFSVSGEKIR